MSDFAGLNKFWVRYSKNFYVILYTMVDILNAALLRITKTHSIWQKILLIDKKVNCNS